MRQLKILFLSAIASGLIYAQEPVAVMDFEANGLSADEDKTLIDRFRLQPAVATGIYTFSDGHRHATNEIGWHLNIALDEIFRVGCGVYKTTLALGVDWIMAEKYAGDGD
ncbi:MAG: hypothetical protein ABIA75_11580 [Candidatus Neomarinimicrobiota bacterium]